MKANNNNNAVREVLSAALEQVNKVYDILSRPCVFIEEARQGCREARGVLIPALAKPPRNCDRFADELDAQLAFLNEVLLISIGRETMTEQDAYENWTDEMRVRYGRWLLAPATEKKGDQL